MVSTTNMNLESLGKQ